MFLGEVEWSEPPQRGSNAGAGRWPTLTLVSNPESTYRMDSYYPSPLKNGLKSRDLITLLNMGKMRVSFNMAIHL